MEESLLAVEGAQTQAATKIQGVARKKKAKKRAAKRRATKERLAEMQAEGKEWSKEEKEAATKLQTQQRIKRDKKRANRIRKSKERNAQLGIKEWTEEEQAAATKLQTRQRIKRDKQRTLDIKTGKKSAFETTKMYKGGSVKVFCTFPDNATPSGTFKVEKKGFTYCAGTFKKEDITVTLSPASEEVGELKIEVDDSFLTFAVQGTDNWLTKES